MEGEWSMDCYMTAAAMEPGNSAFFQPKMRVSALRIEVYITGCCAAVPVILNKTILIQAWLKIGFVIAVVCVGVMMIGSFICNSKPLGQLILCFFSKRNDLRLQKPELKITSLTGKLDTVTTLKDMYAGEDIQLSWFNAGVRVGVGIGLGMCLGVGIGVGLLMRSYQATTRTFKRRFF
ncbi:hypothetical protein CRYUN_Cryun20dG0029500 [Craigia yunnanensis]